MKESYELIREGVFQPELFSEQSDLNRVLIDGTKPRAIIMKANGIEVKADYHQGKLLVKPIGSIDWLDLDLHFDYFAKNFDWINFNRRSLTIGGEKPVEDCINVLGLVELDSGEERMVAVYPDSHWELWKKR